MPDNIDKALFGEGTNDGVSGDTIPSEPQGIENDIDKIFGDPASNSNVSGEDLYGDKPSDKGKEPTIDYTGMNHEQLAKMFQSKYDKAQADLQKVQPKVQKADTLEKFINEIYENQDVRRAFIAELEPDLVKPKDPYGALEEQLKKEFGEEFVPDDEEAKRPFTTSWKYYKKLTELERKFAEHNSSIPKTLKELRAEREQLLQEQAARDAQMKSEVLQTMKWADTDYQSFGGWVSKLTAVDLAKIYRFVQSRKASNPSAPFLAAQSGGTTQTPNEIQTELKKFFG